MAQAKYLSASTLVEVLILMILSGIIFLSVMDGLGALHQFLNKTSERISEHTEQYAGYFRTADLTGLSDSLRTNDEGMLELYRRGVVYARITVTDSALVVHWSEQVDTLLRKIVRLRALPESNPDRRVDSLIVELYTKSDSLLRIGFAPWHRSDPFLEKLTEEEKRHQYKEDSLN